MIPIPEWSGSRCEALLDGFEQAWRIGANPDLDKYVNDTTATGGEGSPADRRSLLLGLVPLDLEYRWRGPCPGTVGPMPPRPRLEHYLARYPELENAGGTILSLLAAEYRIRHLWGDRPIASEFLGRFPRLGDALTQELAQVDAEIARESPAAPSGDSTSLTYAPASTAPSSLDDSLSDQIEILGEIGRGGMGVVYKACDRKLGRIVAIKKMIDPALATVEQVARFRAEAQAVARLRHPNIVVIHSIGEHEGRPYLELEYAEGGTLATKLANGPMAPREAASLLLTLALAVGAAHRAGIVHRDLKPGNILLTSDGVPKVSDFGLARFLDGDSGLTRTGQQVGTSTYMSPEQAAGHANRAGPASDLHALGAILYQALTGRPPFLGQSASETLALVLHSEPVPPRWLRIEVPRDLDTICLKCLEKEPARRYADADGLARDLRLFLEGRPIQARPVGPGERLQRWARRNPGIAGLSVAVVLSLLLGIIASRLEARRAIRAETESLRQRDRAAAEASQNRAVLDFHENLFTQASTAAQVLLGEKPDAELTVRSVLDRGKEKVARGIPGQPLAEASMCQMIGKTYRAIGLFSQAEPLLERALELRRTNLGPDDPETFRSMLDLGQLLADGGRSTEAFNLLTRAMEGLRRFRGPEDLQTLQALHDLGELDGQMGRVEAESLLVKALEGFRRTRGIQDEYTVMATDTLATFYLSRKETARAERLLEATMQELRRDLGDSHPAFLAASTNLAIIQGESGDFAKSERQWRETIRREREALGDLDSRTLCTMILFGQFLLSQNQIDEARRVLLESLKGCRRTFDRNHIATDTTVTMLADVSIRRGQLDEAVKYLIESREITRSRNGPDHPLTYQADQYVGMLLMVIGKYATAEPYLREALAYRLRVDSEGAERWLSELRLGVCLLAQEQKDAASPHLLRFYQSRRPAGIDREPEESKNPGWLVDRITRLRDARGQPLQEAAIMRLRVDPTIRTIVLDLQLPEVPWASR